MREFERLYSFDFLRAFAMMLGLAIHAPLIFYFPDAAKELGITDISPAESWIYLILEFITIWRMPLFFMLAGFFSILVIERKGLNKFIQDRFIRIGIACVFFAASLDLLDGNLDFTLDHLWFLYYLMLFIILLSLQCAYPKLKHLITSKLTIKGVIKTFLSMLLLIPLSVLFSGTWQPLSFFPPSTYFDIDIGAVVYYFSFYFLGAILYSNQEFFRLIDSRIIIIISGLLSIIVFFLYLRINDYMFRVGNEELYFLFSGEEAFHDIELNPIIVFINNLIKQLNTILWIVFLMSISRRYITSDSKILRWFVELSYPVYILHLTPIVLVSAELYKAGFDQFQIFIISILIGFSISVILYYAVIKFSPLNWLLNGYKRSYFKIRYLKD